MTGFSALFNAVSGLQSQSSRITIDSQNIANLNTAGYKEATTTFANLIGGNIAGSVDTGGAKALVAQDNDSQGDVTPDSVPTNIAISGSGFFAVTPTLTTTGGATSAGILYTRAGNFLPNQNGNLVNGAGYFLQGWKLNSDGTLPADLQGSPDAGAAEGALTSVVVPQSNGTPTATSVISFKDNLDSSQAIYSGTPPYNAADPAANMASGAVEPQFSEQVTIVDSAGAAHNATVGFIKTGINSWSAELYADTPSDIAGGNPQIAAGAVSFNGDGTLNSVSPTLTQPATINWTNAGAAPSTIALSWGTAGPAFGTPGATIVGRSDGLEQLDSTSASNGTTNNGVQSGSLEEVTVSPDGYLVGTYSNGSIQKLYMIPVARFLDPNQLAAVNSTAFSPTNEASTPEYVQPGTQEGGTLQGGAIEESSANEDSDLTNLIISQQSYQFNSKLISTDNEMLQSLTQMVV